MELIPSTIVTVEAQFDSFEVFEHETRAWDLRTTLLEPGGFRADILQHINPLEAFHFGRASFDTALRQVGSPPTDMVTFVIPSNAGFAMDWRRQTVTGHDIAVFPQGGELYANVRPDFDVRLISYRRDVVLGVCEDLKLPRFEQQFLTHEVFRCDEAGLGHVRTLLSHTESALRRDDERDISFLRHHLLECLVETIFELGSTVETYHPQAKDAAVRMAIDMVEATPDECVTVRELCAATGVSERTLQVGFKERLGVSPKRFIQAVRLGRVRRDLLETPSRKLGVIDVANRWGFWHMGQFAADYRRMFMELPSETLRRSHPKEQELFAGF